MCLIRTLLAREQARMRGEYEERLRELERERVTAEADKAQARTSLSKRCKCTKTIAASVLHMHYLPGCSLWR